MKKLFTQLSFFLILASTAFAQTNITTATVSGTWTLAGSPYIVQVGTNVPPGQVLTIEPGVVVKFWPSTRLMAQGQLIAAGTMGSPITFEANDTTGWYNQTNSVGGWNGIHFYQFSGGGTDNSIINYCTIRDVKYGYNSVVSYCEAFSTERGIKILNSTFDHNHAGIGMYLAGATVSISTYLSTDTVEMNNCVVSNNYSSFGIVRTTNSAGATKIIKSNLHDNHLGSAIWGIWNNLLIEDNLVHDNDMIYDNAPIKVSIGTVTIRGNKVYRNVCEELAAIGCRSGKVLIENNLICNNRQTNPSCGALGGGGGLHLAHNEGGAAFSDTWYTVRNNVIANNYSAYGGGGIYVYHARATISNNHIINNYTSSGMGKALLTLDPATEVYLKNNIFFSKSNLGVVDLNTMIFVLSAYKLQVDYNYLPSTYHTAVTSASSYIMVGDTVNNVIGIDPEMIAPTANYDYTTDALTADFQLLPSSACINRGDTVGTQASNIDYNSNPRIVTVIDIGAFESSQLKGIEDLQNPYSTLSVYPNPVQTNHQFTVITPDAKGVLIVQDLSGKMVHQQAVTSTETIVNLSINAKGIYLLSYSGKRNASARIVVN